MSFGVSISDFLAVIELAKRIRKDFADAPNEFKGALDVVRSLSIVLQDAEVAASGWDLSPQQETDLQTISDGCQSILAELERTLAKYTELESHHTGIRRKIKRVWKRLSIEPEDIRNLRSRVNDNIALLNTFTLQQTRNDTTRLVRYQEDQEQQSILDWLCPVDYFPQQNDFLRQRQAGTGQWLLDSTKFKAWIETKHQTLFCPGIPGAGKTILTSIVVEQLFTRIRGDCSIAFAYIYCNFKRQHEQSLEHLLASLLKQLAQGRHHLPENVKTIYARCRDQETRPSVDDISAVLQSVAAEYSRVFIVIDALDECQVNNGCLAKLLSHISNLQSKCRVNFFATSRFIPDITERFQRDVRLEIRANKQDVQRYVEGHIDELPRFVRRDPDLQQEISSEIVKAVDGMYVASSLFQTPADLNRFLLAQLHIHSLKGKRAPTAVRDALKKLPTGTEAYDYAYSDAMKRIEGQLSDQAELAKEVLSWITCAKRPLTTLELQHALAIKADHTEFDEGNKPDIEDIVSVCAGLVTVDEEGGIIRLVHYTTQEYFERTQKEWFPTADFDISASCVTYLSFSVFAYVEHVRRINGVPSVCYEKSYNREVSDYYNDAEDREDNTYEGRFRERMLLYPLYDYATQYWGHHARQALSLPRGVLELLQCEIKAEAAAQALLYRWPHGGYTQKFPGQMTGLHLAAYFGITESFAKILQSASVNAKDSYDRTPLSHAAEEGHSTVVKQLLEAGADIESKDQRGQTSLHYAVGNGHLAVVKQLLEAGADIESKGQRGQTSLHYAVGNGHLAVIKQLLEAGAKVESKDKEGQTSLHYAAENGHLAVVKQLLEAGAEIDSKDIDGRTPLSHTAGKGHSTVVKQLLEAGAEIDSKNNHGQTPLLYAVWVGYSTVVKQLLEAGAEVDLKDNYGRTPLSDTAWKGHLIVVEQLLEAGADIESKDKEGKTSLYYAAVMGHSIVVKQLLEAGAEVDLKDKYGQTPLTYAAWKGHSTVVKQLLEAGADIESKDKEVVVKQLLEARADPASKDKYSRTPLSYALKDEYWSPSPRKNDSPDGIFQGV
ncbi:hypothetical protein MMC26_004190 [Xylographa opegraphella]|nr:hypothetical protein [Xylographa opegraphella]